MLPKEVAIPEAYDSFFSFPAKKSGYCGVATYTRSSVVTPLKAEEGLTGLIQLKPPFTPEERVSQFQNYPPQFMDGGELDYKHLDSEGRAVTVDFGLFVLINLYCPNDGVGTEERDKFKMDYHRLLSDRVKGLLEEGREVIVLGDINACAAVIDHCEGNIIVARGKAAGLEGEDGFWENEYRVWLRDWLQKEDGTGGPLVDIVRRFWPNRKGMYTCEFVQRNSPESSRLSYA
jgi:AP endonuclease-2